MDSKQNLFNDEEFKEILDKDLLELLGAKEMALEKKQELYTKMAQTVQNRVIARIDDRLNEKERAEWLKLIDKNDKSQMEEFLKSKGINVAKWLIEEAIIYKTEMMALFKQSQGEK